jgi:hypothetical protein
MKPKRDDNQSDIAEFLFLSYVLCASYFSIINH